MKFNYIQNVNCSFSVVESCLTLWNPMDWSKPGFPVLLYLPEFAQTHVIWVSGAIQPSHPLLSLSLGFNLSQHQGLLQWVSQLLASGGQIIRASASVLPVGCFERTALKYVYYLGWKRSPAQAGCMRQVLEPGALGRPRGIEWRGRWEQGLGWGIHVNPWLIHVNVWQKSLQYCKVISLQLLKINGKKIK